MAPLDVILELVRQRNTLEAQQLLGDIKAEIGGSSDAAPWINACRIACDLGALSDDEMLYLAYMFSEVALDPILESDPVLVALQGQLAEIRRLHGLTDDEDFFIDDAPEDWAAVNKQWDARFTRLHAQILRSAGETAMALDLTLGRDVDGQTRPDGKA